MIKPSQPTVKVAELKARLSEYLRRVRRGDTVTVCDRDTPIARLVPIEEPVVLRTRKPVRALRDVTFPPAPKRRIDSLAALLEERQPSR